MKYLFILIITAPLALFGQNKSINSTNNVQEYKKLYPNGQIEVKGKKIDRVIVDTMFTYYQNGSLRTMQVFQGNQYPRKVYYYENLRHMAAKKRDGYFIQNNDTTYIKEGIWKYYYKNGQVMDSLVYKNGEEIYRIRLSKK
jgi:antitoxin component YwqK of YwqJK toxin-antitoxin module